MQNEMRNAIVNYMNVVQGNERTGRMPLASPLHPRLRKIYTYLKPKFEEIIIGDHNLLSLQEHRDKFLKYLPTDDLQRRVQTLWKNAGDQAGDNLWKIFQEEYNKAKRGKLVKDNDLSIEALVLKYMYPRIDANVSTGINHLLKSPWCVHPKTGKICVPIDATKPDDFNCEKVPTLTSVINELGEAQLGKEEGDSVTPPCLVPFMKTFKTFLRKSAVQSAKENNKQEGESEAF